jgi:hypothetical protein
MKIIVSAIFIVVAFTSSTFAGELYTWIDKNGVENITTTPPPETAKEKHRTKYERQSEKEIAAFEKKQKAAIDKSFTGWQKSQKQTSGVRSSSSSSNSVHEDKCKSASDKWKKAYQEYNEEKNRNANSAFKKPSTEEKRLRAEMFKAQEEEHACLFSPENIKSGRVHVEQTTTTITRGGKGK